MRNLKYIAVLVLLATVCLAQATQPEYVTKTMQTPEAIYLQVDLPGFASTFLMGIAANGRITGFASVDPAPTSLPSQYLKAAGFVLQNGKVTVLVHPDPADPAKVLPTYPLKIRTDGTVTGWSAPETEPSGAEIGWVWEKGRFRDVVYEGPDYDQLDPGINYSMVTDVMSINGRGDMIGQVGYIDPNDPTGGSIWRGWMSKKGAFQLIDPPGAALTYPADINERGEVVGIYRTVDMKRLGFLREPDGELLDINFPPPLPATTVFMTFPQAINNLGDIVGFYALKPGFPQGFLLRKGSYTPIDVPDAIHTVVYGIDETGVMVGSFKDGTGVHGFIRIPKK